MDDLKLGYQSGVWLLNDCDLHKSMVRIDHEWYATDGIEVDDENEIRILIWDKDGRDMHCLLHDICEIKGVSH